MDSTAPVFTDGRDRVGKGCLAVRKFEEERVVVAVQNRRQLAIHDTGPLIEILCHHHAHIAKGEELVGVIFQRYG